MNVAESVDLLMAKRRKMANYAYWQRRPNSLTLESIEGDVEGCGRRGRRKLSWTDNIRDWPANGIRREDGGAYEGGDTSTALTGLYDSPDGMSIIANRNGMDDPKKAFYFMPVSIQFSVCFNENETFSITYPNIEIPKLNETFAEEEIFEGPTRSCDKT